MKNLLLSFLNWKCTSVCLQYSGPLPILSSFRDYCSCWIYLASPLKKIRSFMKWSRVQEMEYFSGNRGIYQNTFSYLELYFPSDQIRISLFSHVTENSESKWTSVIWLHIYYHLPFILLLSKYMSYFITCLWIFVYYFKLLQNCILFCMKLVKNLKVNYK